ncbi:phage head completion protein [Corynebacterium atypicum]|nr:head-tail adaptor protein [Corynebacterium atypicum]
MRETIDLITPVPVRDAAGFTSSTAQVASSVRAYREVRHASSAWVNRAAYTQATVLFRIRVIPGLTVSEVMQIAACDGRYVIDTVEPIGGYIEILAHRLQPEGAHHGAGPDPTPQ